MGCGGAYAPYAPCTSTPLHTTVTELSQLSGSDLKVETATYSLTENKLGIYLFYLNHRDSWPVYGSQERYLGQELDWN